MKMSKTRTSPTLDSDDPVLFNTPMSDKVECYYDSEGDVIFLESLLSDDSTHNLAPEVISDHEPKQDESIHNTSITFSPRSDPLHHEFAGELITLPSRIARDHEEYLSRMTLLCEIINFRSQENVHTAFNYRVRVENDDFEDEDNELPNFDHQDNPSSPRPPSKPPDVCFNIAPDTAIKNDEDFNQWEIVLPLNVEDVNSFTFFIWTFLPLFHLS
ncbi:hypothetical protein Tco_0921344 [Tanacetum coccineum]